MGFEHASHAQRNHSRTADQKHSQELTEKQGNTNTITSGFQKTRSCVMTWENLRGKPEEVVDPTSLSTKSHSHTANSMEKKRTKTTLPGLSPAPKKGKKLPEEKIGRMSLQLLEGSVNPELSEFASQDDPDGETYSPPGTPTQWQALPTARHDHSDDVPQW